MNNNRFKRDDRGQVGIGTLIVFIAMVLVAAIAAGVLVNTAGFLQSKAQQTGEQSTNAVTNRVQVLSTYGTVHQLDPASEDGTPGDGDDYYTASDSDGTNDDYLIDELNFIMMRSAGSDNIQLDKVVLMWQGPDGAEQVTLGSPGADYTVSTAGIVDVGSNNVLSEDSSRAKVTLSLDPTVDGSGNKDTAIDALQTGETVTVKFTTVSGATVTKVVSVPSTFPQNDGEVVAL